MLYVSHPGTGGYVGADARTRFGVLFRWVAGLDGLGGTNLSDLLSLIVLHSTCQCAILTGTVGVLWSCLLVYDRRRTSCKVSWSDSVDSDVLHRRSAILNVASDVTCLELRYVACSNELIAVAVSAEYDWEGEALEHPDHIAVFR